MAKLSEGIVARTLWNKYGQGQWAAANIHYYAFESDLLIVRKSGTVVEYEVKLSISDYRAGLKKRQCINPYNTHKRQSRLFVNQELVSRHDYLTAGMGANMFYYVAPEGVLKGVDIPDWAGIIQVRETQTANSCGSFIVRKAKKLHKGKADEAAKNRILISCYYKYWNHFAVKNINQT